MYFIRLCLLLFYLKTLIHCDIITLKYNNSVVCVATESDVDSTIYLQPQIGNATLNKTLKVEFEWTNDDWEYKILNRGIVTDQRWQEFKIVENVTYNKSGTYGLSMCGKGNLTLDNTSMIQHSTNRMCDEWKHYKVEIEKTNTSSIITVFDETNRTITKTYGVDETIEIKSTQGPSFWKMHQIKCKGSATPSVASSSIDVFWSGKVHLSMFVYLNVNSRLNIKLQSDNKKVSRTIHGQLYSAKWRKVELTIESVNKTTLYIDRITNNDKEKSFWAIDAINFRSHEPAIYQAHLTEHYESTFPICKQLNYANHLRSTRQTKEFTQDEDNSSCEFVHKADFSPCQPDESTNGLYYNCDTCHKCRGYDDSDLQRPQNLTLKINSSNEVIVTWEHPFVKYFYLNISSKGTTKNSPVNWDNCRHKYGKSITIENDIMYKISVWPESSQTENVTITALFKASPPELSSKPFLKLCFGESDINCTFLIPKPKNSTETRIEVVKNGTKWYIPNLHVDDNDYLSVANDFLSLNCFQDEVKQTLPVYLINGNRSYLICQATNQAPTTERAAIFICFIIVAVVTFLFLGYLIFAYTFRKYPFGIKRTRSQNKHEFHPPETIDTLRSYQEKNVRTIRKKYDLRQDGTELEVLIESEKPREIDSVPILVKDFENYLIASLEDNSFYHNSLTDQHKNLQTNKNKKSCTTGSLQKNNHRNRYNNILAYDHSRVILQKMDGMGTDNYINANYVNGLGHPKAYIATQGPKFSTVRDFWRMIWQEQVQTIVMATNFVEFKKRKCAEYWPQRLNCIFECGEMGITLKSEENFEHYDRRTLEMNYRGEVRAVQHYHLKWNPDQLTPLYPDRVVPLVKQIRNIRENSTTPIVIHCSSGVNRTGTLILCDMALQMATEQNKIDFYKLTKDLRDQRPNMVSTEKQYLLAHLVVLECLMEEENVFRKIIRENFALKRYKAQLNYLDRLHWHDEEVQSWIPYQVATPFSGIPVDGYAKSKKYVVLPQPHENSLSNFWDLVLQEKIEIILFLNESKCDIWPYSNRKYDSDVSVKAVDQICTNYCTTTELLLKYTTQTTNINYIQRVYLFQLTRWNSTEVVPQKVESVLNILDDIQKNYYFEKPILLACHDGIVASGFFAALSYIIEKFQKEVEFDICNGVRTVRRSCKQFVNTTMQVEFLYVAVLEYLQKFDSYSCIL